MAFPVERWPIERGLAKTFAGHIHWGAAGKGPTVMITHVNEQTPAMMLELLQASAPEFRTVAIDYPCHSHMLQTECPHAQIEFVPGGNFCMTWERTAEITAHARTFLP